MPADLLQRGGARAAHDGQACGELRAQSDRVATRRQREPVGVTRCSRGAGTRHPFPAGQRIERRFDQRAAIVDPVVARLTFRSRPRGTFELARREGTPPRGIIHAGLVPDRAAAPAVEPDRARAARLVGTASGVMGFRATARSRAVETIALGVGDVHACLVPRDHAAVGHDQADGFAARRGVAPRRGVGFVASSCRAIRGPTRPGSE